MSNSGLDENAKEDIDISNNTKPKPKGVKIKLEFNETGPANSEKNQIPKRSCVAISLRCQKAEKIEGK